MLFNQRRDPGERIDLVLQSGPKGKRGIHLKRISELSKLLRATLKRDAHEKEIVPVRADLKKEDIEALKALGYIE